MKEGQINTKNITDLRSFLINMVQQGKTEEMIDMVLDIIEKLRDETIDQARLIRWLRAKPYRSSSEVVNYCQRSLFGDDESEIQPEIPVETKHSSKKKKNMVGVDRNYLSTCPGPSRLSKSRKIRKFVPYARVIKK